jgi:poly(3-hydroxybutyrate) depolymerase
VSSSSNSSSASAAAAAVPLVLDLHGYNLCAVYQANFTGWRHVAEELGAFVLVWPQGNMNANLSNHPCWDFGDCCCALGPPPPPAPPPENNNATTNSSTGSSSSSSSSSSNSSNLFDSFVPGPDMDDEGFLRQVVANVVAKVASGDFNVTIDTKRIYFGGHSNGCMMSQAMAALSSDLVAAVCCHASSLPPTIDVTDDYIPTSVQVVYGDLDTTIPALFGSFSHIIDTWSAINACQSNSTIIVDKEYAIDTRFNCTNDTLVQTIELFDTGHFPFQGFNPNNSL